MLSGCHSLDLPPVEIVAIKLAPLWVCHSFSWHGLLKCIDGQKRMCAGPCEAPPLQLWAWKKKSQCPDSVIYLFVYLLTAEPRDTPKGVDEQKTSQKGTDCIWNTFETLSDSPSWCSTQSYHVPIQSMTISYSAQVPKKFSCFLVCVHVVWSHWPPTQPIGFTLGWCQAHQQRNN